MDATPGLVRPDCPSICLVHWGQYQDAPPRPGRSLGATASAAAFARPATTPTDEPSSPGSRAPRGWEFAYRRGTRTSTISEAPATKAAADAARTPGCSAGFDDRGARGNAAGRRSEMGLRGVNGTGGPPIPPFWAQLCQRGKRSERQWCAGRELNPQPSASETDALSN